MGSGLLSPRPHLSRCNLSFRLLQQTYTKLDVIIADDSAYLRSSLYVRTCLTLAGAYPSSLILGSSSNKAIAASCTLCVDLHMALHLPDPSLMLYLSVQA